VLSFAQATQHDTLLLAAAAEGNLPVLQFLFRPERANCNDSEGAKGPPCRLAMRAAVRLTAGAQGKPRS
jgi:hypothetical protein